MSKTYRDSKGRFTKIPQTLSEKVSHHILDPLTKKVIKHLIPEEVNIGEIVAVAKEQATANQIPISVVMKATPREIVKFYKDAISRGVKTGIELAQINEALNGRR